MPREPVVMKNMTSDEALFPATVEQSVGMVQDTSVNGLFAAAAEAVEESFPNALCLAESMEGPTELRRRLLTQRGSSGLLRSMVLEGETSIVLYLVCMKHPAHHYSICSALVVISSSVV